MWNNIIHTRTNREFDTHKERVQLMIQNLMNDAKKLSNNIVQGCYKNSRSPNEGNN